MATHSNTLVWEIPWTKEPGRLQSTGSQRVEHDLATKQQQQGSVTNISPLKPTNILKTFKFMKRQVLATAEAERSDWPAGSGGAEPSLCALSCSPDRPKTLTHPSRLKCYCLEKFRISYIADCQPQVLILRKSPGQYQVKNVSSDCI